MSMKNQFFQGIKNKGPKALKFIKDNRKDIAKGITLIGAVGKTVNEFRSGFKKYSQEKKKSPSEIHFRKARYIEYKSNILPNMNGKSRHELFSYKLEVEGYIEQIEKEENTEFGVMKPLHTKRTRNWESILLQIQDKIRMLDYQEYLKVFNNTNYNSNYFEGFASNVESFKQKLKCENVDELYEYIEQQTQKRKDYIKKDFVK
jgi:hypothetical protein